jgi:hypothetical protein
MKLKSLIIIVLVSISLGIACKKSWLDVNTSPNDLPSTISNYVFSGAQNTSAYNYWGDNGTGQRSNELGAYWAGQWTQSTSYILVTNIFGYLFTNGDFNYWDDMYNNLQDYQYVINNAEKDGQKFLIGPAQIMKAMIYQNLVDMYGNIPYSDALKGLNSIAPKFDDQKAVYEDLIKLLDSGITAVKASTWLPNITGSDVVFKGDKTKWVRFANSLKMRILIRQSRIPGRDAYITTEINKIVTEGSGFIGNNTKPEDHDVAVNPGFQAAIGKQNPFYDRWGYDPAGTTRSLGRFPRPTKFLFDMLIGNNDTMRLKRIAYGIGGENGNAPGTSKLVEVVSNYKAVPFGVGSGFSGPSTSYMGPSMIVKGQYKPVILMTSAESSFLLAEAMQRFPGVTLTGTAQSYYEDGVRESFRLLGVPNGLNNANALLTGGKVDADWAASPNKLEAIAIQKWLALTNFNGLEAWSEYRKTGLPVTPQSQAVSDPNKRPVRLYYPNTELGSNEANVKAQGTIDVFATRLFWDVD